MTRVLLVLVTALVVAPVGLADGISPGAVQNGLGVLAPDGKTRFVAVGTYGDDATMVTRIDARTGYVGGAIHLLGAWGIPSVTAAQEGVSADGTTLVLAKLTFQYPPSRSSFVVVDTKRLRVRHAFSLNGDFAYDALSPDGRRLYLIQHTYGDQMHYVVRAYDTERLRLLPGRIADRTQKSWVMQGWPVSRATSANGRWVYTLYANPGGFPFVHALDTVRGVAHCIGLPWRGGENAPYNMVLALHGNTLRVHWRSGRPWYVMDTRTWKLSPDRGGFPWWTLAFLALLPLVRFHPSMDFVRRRAAASVAAWPSRP